jgi:transposase
MSQDAHSTFLAYTGNIKRVEETGLPKISRAIQTFRNWQTEILNSFVYNYLNGFLERINNLTKVIKRNAFGYRCFERFPQKYY